MLQARDFRSLKQVWLGINEVYNWAESEQYTVRHTAVGEAYQICTYKPASRIYLGYAWGYDLNFKRIVPLDFGLELCLVNLSLVPTRQAEYNVNTHFDY